MDKNHQDKTESKPIATEDDLWLPPLSPKDQKRLKHLQKKSFSQRMGFSNKTGWDWLDLIAKLAVPLILGIATLLFSLQQANLVQQQHLQDQAIALDQQRQATLVKYQDDMRDLLLNRGLLTSKPGDAIRVIALTETLSAMRQLDAKRNSFLIQFLQNAHLNGVDYRTSASYNIVNFLNADLSHIDFSGTNLNNANLYRAYLINANLNGADLIDTNLINANLINADLRGADLSFADLTQQQLDQVLTCKYAILPRLTCHHNQ